LDLEVLPKGNKDVQCKLQDLGEFFFSTGEQQRQLGSKKIEGWWLSRVGCEFGVQVEVEEDNDNDNDNEGCKDHNALGKVCKPMCVSQCGNSIYGIGFCIWQMGNTLYFIINSLVRVNDKCCLCASCTGAAPD
jgi:hypothetical protein